MVLPIGFFAPLPLAIMIPFMAAQSFAMGHAFGTSFQYGKRKISSMTNEEFNKASPTMIHEELQADIRAMIPSMNQSFRVMEQFQIDILNSMINTIRKAGEEFFGFITGTGTSTTTSSTSAIDFSDTGVFEIQGGPRGGDNKSTQNPSNEIFRNAAGQTYDEWIAFNKVDENIQKKKDTTKGFFERAKKEAPKFENIVTKPIVVTPKQTNVRTNTAQQVYNNRKQAYLDEVQRLKRIFDAQFSLLRTMKRYQKEKTTGVTKAKYQLKINRQIKIVKKAIADLAMQKRKAGNFKAPFFR